MATDARTAPAPEPVSAPEGYGFPRTPDAMLSWADAVGRLAAARTYWLATVTPAGRPYLTPLWGVWVDGALWFDGMPTTRWARNFGEQPVISVSAEVDGVAVILSGTVEDLEANPRTGARIVDAWDAKYGRAAPEPVEQGLFRLQPRTVRAWSESLRDGAQWRLGGVVA